MAKSYSLIFGILYIAVALVEVIFRNVLGGHVFFTPVHNSVHWVAGVLGLVAYWAGLGGSKLYARVFGLLFLAIFILGVTSPVTLANFLGYPVSTTYNIVHLISGAVGLYAGFLAKDHEIVV